MAKISPEIRAHRLWLGLVRPVGLVVSPPALVKAQAVPNQNISEKQRELRDLCEEDDEGRAYLPKLMPLLTQLLEWEGEDVAGAGGSGPELNEAWRLVLPDYDDIITSDMAALDWVDDQGGTRADDKDLPLMLIRTLPAGQSFDDTPADSGGWQASPQAKLERLLREVGVGTGLLFNQYELRLVYAPKGESSGHLTFDVSALCEVAGRPLLSALVMLLGEERVFGAGENRRLNDILRESRKYQSEVSTALADQVLGALWELLAGFQRADGVDEKRVLTHTAREAPEHVYGGLLTLLMRLIFLLYAEDEGLLPESELYTNHYAVTGLFEKLKADAGRYPDTMDERFGAYAGLLSLFRLVFDGGGHGDLSLPTRHGQLFNPDEYPFLEGRPLGVARVRRERISPPQVSDGCIYRVLRALLVLEGERLSYRALDVEQIGSVYEAMMGYEVQVSAGHGVCLKPKHIVVDVDELLTVPGTGRGKWLKDHAEAAVTGKSVKALKEAKTHDELMAALGRRISPRSLDEQGAPRLLTPGSLYLQPGEERRRTGSHYTPRELTAPIVAKTLEPIFAGLGKAPTPKQILALKICDPAMGSGAFLVETCRQLAQALVEAWQVHKAMPVIPPDEEPLLHARRLVAQQCLYGVDKNPFAVNLAKLSLWLVTLARDHAFTFLDHCLKYGDSLVGFNNGQIGEFHWQVEENDWGPLFQGIKSGIKVAVNSRAKLHTLSEGNYLDKKAAWQEAEDAVGDARLVGDLLVAAFFAGAKAKAREEYRQIYRDKINAWRDSGQGRVELEDLVNELRGGERPLPPFHWELEFPEVFQRRNPGFDGMVGNPPFLGGKKISTHFGDGYRDWLPLANPAASSNADIVAHFFRRAFSKARDGGTFGLIATNTVGQGDTRQAGLTHICTHGGEIYSATRRLKWPGLAAVVVSVVHVLRGASTQSNALDGVGVPQISAFLVSGSTHRSPQVLRANSERSFQGSIVLGMGFTFDDTDKKGKANTHAEMLRLIEQDPRNQERIFPYIGGKEINTSPTHAHHRYVINFGEMSEPETRQWPDLIDLLESKVAPERASKSRDIAKYPWWLHWRPRPDLFRAIEGLERVLLVTRLQQHWATALLDAKSVFAESLIVFPFDSHAAFANLQSRVHELWARFFGSSMKDDLRYTPSDCFETFPFPPDWTTDPNLEKIGEEYYQYRAQLMIQNNEGMTQTYNRFHDPHERDPEILELRRLHGEMDRAVLDAYGWSDVPTECEFLLDYEIDEATWGTKKKPYRYRWPQAVHDEVLGRLLALNEERYKLEVAQGLHGDTGKAGKRAKPGTKRKTPAKQAGAKTARKPRKKRVPKVKSLSLGLDAGETGAEKKGT